MNNKLLILIIIIFAGCVSVVHSQPHYLKGYIITSSKDTLTGLVYDGGSLRNSKYCLFKENRKAKKVKYFPDEVKFYGTFGNKRYIATDVFYKNEFRHVYANVLLEGEISLYYYWRNKEMAFSVQKRNGKIIPLLNKESGYGTKSESFYNQLNPYENETVYKDSLFSLFRDSEEIQNKVENTAYNQKYLIKLTKDYIKETCKGNDCISYEKDLSRTRESFGVFSGIQFSKISFWVVSEEVFTNKYPHKINIRSEIAAAVPLGIYLNLPLPYINDRLSFQMELIMRKIIYSPGTIEFTDIASKSADINSTSLSFPLLLKYKIPGRIVSPTLAFGKETGFVVDNKSDFLYKTFKGGWFYEAGINYKLGSKLSLFTNIRFQSNYTFLSDDNLNRLPLSEIDSKSLYTDKFKTNYASLLLGINF